MHGEAAASDTAHSVLDSITFTSMNVESEEGAYSLFSLLIIEHFSQPSMPVRSALLISDTVVVFSDPDMARYTNADRLARRMVRVKMPIVT